MCGNKYQTLYILKVFFCTPTLLKWGWSAILWLNMLFKNSTNKSFVTEHDQRPRRLFDTELKECQSNSPKQINDIIVENSLVKIQVWNQQRAITPKVWCLELWFLCTAHLLNELYLPMTFQISSLNTFRVMLQTKFKNKNEQKGKNFESMKLWVMVLVYCTSPQWDLSTYEVSCWCLA